MTNRHLYLILQPFPPKFIDHYFIQWHHFYSLHFPLTTQVIHSLLPLVAIQSFLSDSLQHYPIQPLLIESDLVSYHLCSFPLQFSCPSKSASSLSPTNFFQYSLSFRELHLHCIQLFALYRDPQHTSLHRKLSCLHTLYNLFLAQALPTINYERQLIACGGSNGLLSRRISFKGFDIGCHTLSGSQRSVYYRQP